MKILFVILCAGLVVLGLGYWWYSFDSSGSLGVCLHQTRICPDGTVISRGGTSCEWHRCPQGVVQGRIISADYGSRTITVEAADTLWYQFVLASTTVIHDVENRPISSSELRVDQRVRTIGGPLLDDGKIIAQNITLLTNAHGASEEVVRDAHLGEEIKVFDIILRPDDILEDSRCPRDVVCVRAGTVRVRLSLETAEGSSVQMISVSQILDVGGTEISFLGVEPEPQWGNSIEKEDYIFRFRIMKISS